ncbi:MAG: hypothetical protein KAJ18_01705 [Candidatus Omnitrophica bacterium]|nr:hypothetical protein [Candidatus Omnitrophota bacterium]
MKYKNKFQHIIFELAEHLPYSIFSVMVGMLLMGVLSFLAILARAEHLLPQASKELFHVFHPAHILFSAVATTAMFVKHEKRLLKAVLVGFIGSITICGLSDIFFPFFGGVILGQKMQMHLCIINEPGLVFPFAIIGVLAGLLIANTIEHSTVYSHSAHVFVSSVASILYLISYGLYDWIHLAGGVFLVTVVAVVIPCCVSDVVFPLCCVHNKCDHD